MTRDAVRMLVASRSDGSSCTPTSPSCPASSTRVTWWSSTRRGPWPPSSTARAGRIAPAGPPLDPSAGRAVDGRGPTVTGGLPRCGTGRHHRPPRRRPGGTADPLLPGPGGGRGAASGSPGSTTPERLHTYLARHGRPIRYGYVRGSYPITGVPERLRHRARLGRDAECRPPVTPEVLDPPGRQGRGRGPRSCSRALWIF